MYPGPVVKLGDVAADEGLAALRVGWIGAGDPLRAFKFIILRWRMAVLKASSILTRKHGCIRLSV